MALIIEIALGIVLGFLILSNLEALLGLALVLLVCGATLAATGGVIYWATTNATVATLIVIFAACFLGVLVFAWLEKRTGLAAGDIAIFVAILFLLGAATWLFATLAYKWASEAADASVYFYLSPIIGLWAWFGYASRIHIRTRITSGQSAERATTSEKDAAFKVFLKESLARRKAREAKGNAP